MQKKIFAWAMSMAVAAMITCTGCAQNTNSSGTDSGSSTAQTTTLDDNDTAEAAVGQSLSAIQSGEAGVTTDEDDLCDNYDAFDAEITLEDDSTKVKGNTKAVSVKDNCVTISAGGTYRLSGKLTKGQVLVTGSEKAAKSFSEIRSKKEVISLVARIPRITKRLPIPTRAKIVASKEAVPLDHGSRF